MELPVLFDFFPTLIDPKKFLDALESRQIADLWIDAQLLSSPKNMSDKELAEAFIDDILAVTMWELQTGLTLNFNKVQLLRFVSEDQHDRIWDMINHPDVAGLIQFNEDQIRIRLNKEVLQAAMDYCGAFYSGYKMTNGVIVVSSAVRGSIQSEEELDNLYKAMAMELRGHESNETLH